MKRTKAMEIQMDNEITYYVDNYFQGFQCICIGGHLLTWFHRETGKDMYAIATLGMDGVE